MSDLVGSAQALPVLKITGTGDRRLSVSGSRVWPLNSSALEKLDVHQDSHKPTPQRQLDYKCGWRAKLGTSLATAQVRDIALDCDVIAIRTQEPIFLGSGPHDFRAIRASDDFGHVYLTLRHST